MWCFSCQRVERHRKLQLGDIHKGESGRPPPFSQPTSWTAAETQQPSCEPSTGRRAESWSRARIRGPCMTVWAEGDLGLLGAIRSFDKRGESYVLPPFYTLCMYKYTTCVAVIAWKYPFSLQRWRKVCWKIRTKEEKISSFYWEADIIPGMHAAWKFDTGYLCCLLWLGSFLSLLTISVHLTLVITHGFTRMIRVEGLCTLTCLIVCVCFLPKPQQTFEIWAWGLASPDVVPTGPSSKTNLSPTHQVGPKQKGAKRKWVIIEKATTQHLLCLFLQIPRKIWLCLSTTTHLWSTRS